MDTFDTFDTLDTLDIAKTVEAAVNVPKPEQPKPKKSLTGYIIIAAFALAVIIFAFVWEAIVGDVTIMPKGRTAEVQAEIAKLSWITPSLLPPNDYSRPGDPVSQITGIVIHFVDNPGTSAEANRNYFANLAYSNANLPADAEKTYASSNFIVGLEGEIIQCVPIDEVAYCTPSKNEETISIECCHPDEAGQFNDDTYASVVRLTAYLCKQFNLTADSLLRHYDVTQKMCPRYYVENPGAWEQFKADVTAAIEAETAA